jgi:hypothetical protein
MPKALPSGYIDLEDAVSLIVRDKCPCPGIILRAEGEDAFRELCRLVLDKKVHPRGVNGDGKTFKADPDQFIDLQDGYTRLVTLRYAPVVDGTGFVFPQIEGPPSYQVMGEDGSLRPCANLIFLESEIEAAFLLAIKPRKRLSLNDRKRAAVLGAFEALGREYLSKLLQKEREAQVIAKVAAEHNNLPVTDRYVRDLWNGH